MSRGLVFLSTGFTPEIKTRGSRPSPPIDSDPDEEASDSTDRDALEHDVADHREDDDVEHAGYSSHWKSMHTRSHDGCVIGV